MNIVKHPARVKTFFHILGCAIVILSTLWLNPSCVKEDILLTDAVQLKFSTDTVAFDTVFVTMGTVTKQVKVYNTYDQPIRISTITLRNGNASRFRLNVDGDTAMVVRNLEIAAHDSAFIFVRANINPNSALEPFLAEDAILLSCNGGNQSIALTAYGRNAVYHVPDRYVRNSDGSIYHDAAGNAYPYSIIDCEHWDHSRPHVIFGYAVVNSNHTLNLQAGDELYFGNNASLWVYDSASLHVQGTHDRPVLFTSIRHDGWYNILPGQWGTIWLSTGSKDNVIDGARIENGYIGVQVDTNVNSNPTLVITNSWIVGHSLAGIVGQGAVIVGDNLLVSDCGTATLALQYGGSYRFSNSTFANYWSYSSRTSPGVILNNYYQGTANRDLRQANFYNCLIYGSYQGTVGEINFDISSEAAANILFNHCLLKSATASDYATVTDCQLNVDPKFIATGSRNYHLDASSPALGAGSYFYVMYPYDLDHQARLNPPAVGAYEYRDTAAVKAYRHIPRIPLNLRKTQLPRLHKVVIKK